ncbi:MAG: IS66 family transposase [Planctomycetota bacterium]
MSETKDRPPCPRCIELEARIAELEKIVAEQKKLIAELFERLNKNSKNSSKPPSTNPLHFKPAPPKKPTGKKRGGQKGHRRAVRPLVPPEKVSQVVDHFPDCCQHCDRRLLDQSRDAREPTRHQVAEIPPIEPTVTEHRLHWKECAICGKLTRAKLPQDVPRGQFGPRLTAILSLLSGGYRIGKRGVRQLAQDLFGLTISTGMVCKLQRRAAEALEIPVGEVADHVKSQNDHVDETGWCEGKKKAWLWVVVAPMATLFRIARRRTAAVAQDLLGEDYRNIAICDRFRSYLWIGKVQLCWAHLRRDFQAMKDRGGTSQPIGEELLQISDALFEWWHRVREGTLARSTFQNHVATLRAECRDVLDRGAACDAARTAATCRELLTDEKYLWTFVRTPGIEPTNNAAERALRHAVLWRKCSYGTDSETGSRFVERILTLSATCRQQGRDVLETLTECIAAHQAAHIPPSLLPQKQRNRLKAA